VADRSSPGVGAQHATQVRLVEQCPYGARKPARVEEVHQQPVLPVLQGFPDRGRVAGYDCAPQAHRFQQAPGSSTGSRPARAWDIELDAAIYDDRDQRVALLFNRRTFTPDHPVIAMGVRVQSFMMTQARFLQGIEAEMARLERQLLRAEFANAERHLLVVTMDAEGLAAVMPHGLEVRAVLTEGPAVLWRRFRRPD
jgi:hypothetical protein